MPTVAWALDLDGVVWLAEQAIPGAAAAVRALQDAGETVLFVTNNSSVFRDDVAQALRRIGIDPGDGVLTSAMAAVALLEPGCTALLCAGPGVRRELEERGVQVVRDGDADVVVVGYHRDFDYDRMAVAARAVRNGARLLATNDDATYPTPEGLLPGGGAILAGIERASGVRAEVAGKPHAPMAALVRQRAGGDGEPGWMVGDRADTDGRFATTLGWRFGLVLSGVTTTADLPVEPSPVAIAPDLAGLVDQVLA